jgi:archaellum component FlaG (FlaF/FlaG flagellin family)
LGLVLILANKKTQHFRVIQNGGCAGRLHKNFSAIDDPQITLNYRGAETLTFFAKVATSVVSACSGNAVLWCQTVSLLKPKTAHGVTYPALPFV